MERGTTATTLNVGGYYIEPGEGDHVGTCKVVVLLHVNLGGSLSKMNKLAYILSLGKNFHQGDFSVGEVGEAGVDTRDFNDVIF